MMTSNECDEKPEIPAETPEKTPEMRLAELEDEYASLSQKYAALQRRSNLEKICFDSGCTDPEYLQFCAERRGVCLDDAEALRHFAGELAVSAPGVFNARINPGSSAGTVKLSTSPSGNAAEANSGDRIALIALSIDNAPDAADR